jgi:NAD kinase
MKCEYLKLLIIGKSADVIGRLKDTDNNEFQKIFEEATFKWYIFRLRVKMEMYNVSRYALRVLRF